MIKKLLTIILTLISTTTIMAGCSKDASNTEIYDMAKDNNIDLKDIEHFIDGKLSQDISIEKNVKTIDLDGDGQEECIINYKVKTKKDPLRILVLSKEKDNWIVKSEIKNVGQSFDKILYKDITGDGNLEIVAGFKVGENTSKGLSIYSYKDGKTEEIFEDYYSKYIVEDIDKDGDQEVILIKEDEREGKSIAQLYKWKNNNMSKIKEVAIKPNENVREKLKQ